MRGTKPDAGAPDMRGAGKLPRHELVCLLVIGGALEFIDQGRDGMACRAGPGSRAFGQGIETLVKPLGRFLSRRRLPGFPGKADPI